MPISSIERLLRRSTSACGGITAAERCVQLSARGPVIQLPFTLPSNPAYCSRFGTRTSDASRAIFMGLPITRQQRVPCAGKWLEGRGESDPTDARHAGIYAHGGPACSAAVKRWIVRCAPSQPRCATNTDPSGKARRFARAGSGAGSWRLPPGPTELQLFSHGGISTAPEQRYSLARHRGLPYRRAAVYTNIGGSRPHLPPTERFRGGNNQSPLFRHRSQRTLRLTGST